MVLLFFKFFVMPVSRGLVSFLWLVLGLVSFSPRWASYFHLLAQMKVTKAKGTPSTSSAMPMPCATHKITAAAELAF